MPKSSAWKHRYLVLRRIVARKMFSLLGNSNTGIQPKSLYNIKKGYHHASRVENFNDTINTDEWQLKVYELAVEWAAKLEDPVIIDVGCGSAWKLVNMFPNHRTTGIEVEPTCSWLKNQYPFRNWLLFNDTDPHTLQGDIVICSDVVEHIQDPDALMNFLSAIQFRYLILSTPERDIIRGKRDYGPPENTSHYREWNSEEFKNYAGRWFTIIDHRIVQDRSISQVVICTANYSKIHT